MHLYLVQHGEALAEAEDPARPLAPAGRKNVAAIARALQHAGIAVPAIYHSGKLRAEQTAAILAEALAPRAGVTALPGLAPKDDPATIAGALRDLEDGAMLVGHLPHLDRLASLLLTGRPEPSVIAFRNAGVVALARDEGDWKVRWVVTPDIAG